MFTLLSPQEQHALAQHYDYDYRKDAYAVAGAILAVGVVGILTSVSKLHRFSGLTALVVAALIVIEQAGRLVAFRKGPAGSLFAALVRPFLKDVIPRQPPTVDRQP
jgi:hypothetical protein